MTPTRPVPTLDPTSPADQPVPRVNRVRAGDSRITPEPSGAPRRGTGMSRWTRAKRRFVTGLAVATTLVLAGCSSFPPGSSADPISPDSAPTAVIGLTYIPNIQFAPFYVADSEGFYTDEATVTLRHHGSSEGLFTAVAAGEEDFVVAGGDEILQARSQGVDIVAVASYYGQYPARFIVPEGSPITSVPDLKGHSVGIPGKYGENWFALLIALQDAGLTESDVAIEEIGYTQQAALMTGKVDSVIGFANSDVLGFEAAGFPVSVIDPKVPLVSICLATTGAYAAAHPQVVSAVVAGMKQGMETTLTDEEQTLTIAADYIPVFRGDTLDTARRVLPATAALFLGPDGTLSPPFDPAQWAQMSEEMASVGLIPTGVDEAAAFTNQYAE